MLGEPRLDLAKLDPETPDLHLEIIAAEKFDGPVGPEPAKVPGPVEPIPVDEGAGDKPLRRQLGPVQVAARDAVPANVNLARRADRDRLAVTVENIYSSVRYWPADGDRGGQRRDIPNWMGRRESRRFGGAVAVEQALRGTRPQHSRRHARVDHVAAGHENAQAREHPARASAY